MTSPFCKPASAELESSVHVRDNRALNGGGNLQFLPHILVQIGDGHAVKRVGGGCVRHRNCFARLNCHRAIRAVAASVTVKFFCTPSRSNFTVAGLPGSHSETASCKSCGVSNVLAIERDDDVAGLDAGLCGGRAGHHITDERAVLVGQIKILRQTGRDVFLQLIPR